MGVQVDDGADKVFSCRARATEIRLGHAGGRARDGSKLRPPSMQHHYFLLFHVFWFPPSTVTPEQYCCAISSVPT